MNKLIVGIILVISMLSTVQANAGMLDMLNIEPGIGGIYLINKGQFAPVGKLDLVNYKDTVRAGIVLAFPVSDNNDKTSSVLAGLGLSASIRPLLKLAKIDWLLPDDYEAGGAVLASELDTLTRGVSDVEIYYGLMVMRQF